MLIVVIFVSEIIVTIAYHDMGQHFWMGIIDAFIVSLAIIPIVYFFFYRPMNKVLSGTLASEERYRLFFEKSGAVMFMIDCETGSIADANPAACYSYGYTQEQVKSLNITDIVVMEKLQNQDLKEFLKIETGPGKPISLRHRTAKGEIRDVRAYRNRITTNGRAYWLSIIHDITQARKATDQLRKLFKGLEQSPVSLVITGVDRTIEYVNPQFCRTSGYSESEVMGKIPRILQTDVNSSEFHRTLWQSIEKDSIWSGDLQNSKKNGELYWERVWIAEVKGEEGELTGFVSVQQDITKEKEAEIKRNRLIYELEQSNKELENFAYIASHDLREPLRKVSSFGQILEQSLEGRLSDDEKENLGFMIDGTKRMQNIIDDLLTYSRLTTEAKPFGPVNLNKIIDDLEKYDLFAKILETEGKIIVSQELPPIYGDEFQIKQLMQNLVDNALKYGKREGLKPLVIIESQTENSELIRISVKDNGIGIDSKYFEIIFKMFKRLHGRGRYEGTGLGLAICKKIIERHGGQIGVDSIPNEGTTFWFTLPKNH